jgi:hypothetical protein
MVVPESTGLRERGKPRPRALVATTSLHTKPLLPGHIFATEGVPGSHKWGHLKHEESDDPKSIVVRGQYISDPFDKSKAVDSRAKRLFEDSRYAPSEAYGGQRAAT